MLQIVWRLGVDESLGLSLGLPRLMVFVFAALAVGVLQLGSEGVWPRRSDSELLTQLGPTMFGDAMRA